MHVHYVRAHSGDASRGFGSGNDVYTCIIHSAHVFVVNIYMTCMKVRMALQSSRDKMLMAEIHSRICPVLDGFSLSSIKVLSVKYLVNYLLYSVYFTYCLFMFIESPQIHLIEFFFSDSGCLLFKCEMLRVWC